MCERRNDPEIVMARAIARTIQLGSISSLRCQKTRNAHPIADVACELMFRGRIRLNDGSMQRRSSTPSGGARRDRTDDLMLAKHALSQLSYSPLTRCWWAWVELNYRPHPYQGCALAS